MHRLLFLMGESTRMGRPVRPYESQRIEPVVKSTLTTKSQFSGAKVRENILLDGAHNNDGIDSLVAYLSKQQFSKLTILLGILEDKDYKDMIGKLKTVSAKFSATKVPIEIKESNLDNLIASFGDTHVTKYENYEAALANIIPNLENDNIFLITGSLYLISAVRKEILEKY